MVNMMYKQQTVTQKMVQYPINLVISLFHKIITQQKSLDMFSVYVTMHQFYVKYNTQRGLPVERVQVQVVLRAGHLKVDFHDQVADRVADRVADQAYLLSFATDAMRKEVQ